jgi:drug/metabolite transporter (DMT)-like permease
LILFVIFVLKDRKRAVCQMKAMVKLKPIAVMVLIGAAAYTGNFLHLKAASAVPASVQFPLVSGGVIVISALVSFFIFREKLSWKEWISIAGAFLSTVLFAF